MTSSSTHEKSGSIKQVAKFRSDITGSQAVRSHVISLQKFPATYTNSLLCFIESRHLFIWKWFDFKLCLAILIFSMSDFGMEMSLFGYSVYTSIDMYLYIKIYQSLGLITIFTSTSYKSTPPFPLFLVSQYAPAVSGGDLLWDIRYFMFPGNLVSYENYTYDLSHGERFGLHVSYCSIF